MNVETMDANVKDGEPMKYVLLELQKLIGNDIFIIDENIGIISFYLWY
jgi:hypothetical protein